MYDVTVELDINTNKVEQALTNLINESVLTEIQGAFADAIDPWTPFLSGALHSDISVSSDGVTYNVPYAKEKYYGEVYHKEVHPLATSHWDEVAMGQGAKDVFEERVREILIRRVSELYG